MLSFILASVLVQQTEPEPKLELKVFEDFALGLVGDSGYRLEVDKRIADRPVVFYLGHRGDGVKDLIRACQNLDLGCYADSEKKKIFVNGPLASAGPTYREKIRQSIIKAQKQVSNNFEVPHEALSDRYNLLHRFLSDQDISKDEADKIREEINFMGGLMDQENRVLAAQLLEMNPADLANRLDLSDGIPIQVAMGVRANREWQKLVADGRSPLYSSDRIAKMEDEDSKKSMEADNEERAANFQKFLNGSPDVQIWFVPGDEGAVNAQLRLVTDDGNLVVARTWYRASIEPTILPGNVSIGKLGEISRRLEHNPDRQILPTHLTVNSIAEDCIKPKNNSVSWLMYPEFRYFDMSASDEIVAGLHANLSEDRWLKCYSDWDRYPNFWGNWKRGLEFITILADKKLGFDELSDWMGKITPEELERARIALNSKNVQGGNGGWRHYALLVQAAIFELQEENAEHFSTKVSELSPDAQKSIYHLLNSELGYWNYPSLHRSIHRKQWSDYVLTADRGDSGLKIDFVTSLQTDSDVKRFYFDVPLAKSP